MAIIHLTMSQVHFKRLKVENILRNFESSEQNKIKGTYIPS